MPSCFRPPFAFAAVLLLPALLPAAVVGTNVPALPLTAERILALPAAEQPAWHRYLAQSRAKAARDQATLAAEMTAAGLTAPLVPAKGRGVSLNQPAAFWSGPDAAHIADIVVSFQTPAGGWNKNTHLTTAPRRPGERSGYEAGYVGTIDNDATITQLRFLAKTIAAAGPAAAPTHARPDTWRASFTQGVDYLLAAQYPNGGWPQVFPLEGGYHDAITFNDGAMINVLTLLHDIAAPRAEFAFVPAELRARAAASAARGLACTLASQITVNGRRTAWCQQVDVLSLAPVGARNYEMPSQSAGESAGIVLYLMALPDPSPAAVAAVHAAPTAFPRPDDRRRRPRRRRVVAKNTPPRRRLQARPRRLRPHTSPRPRRRPPLAPLRRNRLRPPPLRRPRPDHPRRRQRNLRRAPQRLRLVQRRAQARPRPLRQMGQSPSGPLTARPPPASLARRPTARPAAYRTISSPIRSWSFRRTS